MKTWLDSIEAVTYWLLETSRKTFYLIVSEFYVICSIVNFWSYAPQVVLTTLLVACSTSFVLNAYNFLFLKRFAIYVWFAIAPLIWVVCPLTGAAWVTQTYLKYKLVVVNAWVDIPEVWILFALFLSIERDDCEEFQWHLPFTLFV